MILKKAEVNDIKGMTAIVVSAVESASTFFSATQRAALVSGTTRQAFWADLLQRDYVLTAFEMGEIVGFCVFSTRGEISMLYVQPIMQRKGFATRMLLHLKEYASQEGYAHLKINALPEFAEWLEKMGFEKIEDIKREERGVSFDYQLFILDLL
jgi:ribosomal protein S18 acetylase RimI-like enzyme